MREHTYREYLAWQRWWNSKASDQHRLEAYLRLIALRIQQSQSKDPNKLTLDQQILEFTVKPIKSSQPVKPKETLEEATAKTKAAWFGLTGFSKKKK